MKRYVVGFIAFFIIAIIFFVITVSQETLFQGFSSINDVVTSLFLVIGFVMAFIIFLINIKVLSNSYFIYIIENIPEFIPFSHALKNYLLSLIKIKYKIIVLLRTIDDKNYEWVLNQIAAYNNILKEGKTILDNHKDIAVEFIFIDNHSDDIHHLVRNLHTSQYHYIIITTLSAIFKQAIIARENVSDDKKECIQIIGALSSINDRDIQKVIDRDDKIIRIFPPDYDEAKTAVDFMFSKIKSSICIDTECKLYHQKNNIIVIHNGTYGRAVREQCKLFYEKELNQIYNNTTPEMTPIDLQHSIGFYSFDYKRNNDVVYDGIESQSFELFLDEWQEAKNYFFVIGYEPNISNILNYLDKELNRYPKIEKCIVFCGTLSMKAWRDSINKTLKESNNLQSHVGKCYYLKLLLYGHKDNPFVDTTTDTLNLSLHRYAKDDLNEEVDLKKTLMQTFPHKHETEIDNILNYYWTKEESYISIFSTLSMLIAYYSIEHHSSLLKSKNKVLHEYKDQIDILVNGDSINQYTVSLMD